MATDIAIFRINYKSDFIITLESDAGWATPFCIKFWTDSPQRAFYVQYDGETYTHCAPVAGEPTKLMVQMDDHNLGVGDLKYQIAYHFTVADFPNDTEDEVLNQAAVIISEDGQQEQVMLDFNGETAPEIAFSLPAYANEQQRIANEQQRIANEEARIAAEQTRQQNEAQRIANEEARVAEFARLKRESEAATEDANEAAVFATTAADLATAKAQLAQDAATLANQKAQLAADKAALAAAAADLATAKAQLAQEKATYAQTQGDYAKAQGIIAEGDHVRAESDHTRAESDHAAVEVYVDSLGAFDISAYHATGGVLAKYADLTAALGTNGANIPDALRKGGMSVKFVQSSDNKYVEYFLTKDEWSANESDWQKMNLEEEVSQLGQKVGDFEVGTGEGQYPPLFEQINGVEAIIETPVQLTLDTYYNTADAIQSIGTQKKLVGTASVLLNVTPGEKYNIHGASASKAQRLYCFADSERNYTFRSEYMDTRVLGLEITIPNGTAYMVCNFQNYNDQTDGLVKIEEIQTNGLVQKVQDHEERIADLEEQEITIADNLTTDNPDVALSARQGKIIGDILNGTESTQNTPISLDENTYYNTADGRVNIGAQTSLDGYASKLVEVTSGEQYIICGASSSNAMRLYCFADADKVFTYRQQSPIDTRQNPLTITIPDGVAYMVCNFTNYNNQTDGLWRIDAIVKEGLVGRVSHLESEVGKLPWDGKTIVLFGDSIAEGQRYYDTKERFSDWIEKYTGATVINIAVGGAKIRQHVPPVLNPTSQAEAYHATQIYNMVWACVNNDFSYQDAAGEYLPYYVGDGKAFTLMQTIDWANVSAVIIYGGCNDWFNSPKVGTPGDTDITTTCGAINEINRLLSTTYPHVSIYWIAPSIRKIRIERENEPGVYDYYYCDDNFSRVGNTLPQFIEKMMESAGIQNTPCLDMYHTMGWNQYNQIYYYPNSADGDAHFDGTHPHNGYKEMARHIVGFLTANRSFD